MRPGSPGGPRGPPGCVEPRRGFPEASRALPEAETSRKPGPQIRETPAIPKKSQNVIPSERQAQIPLCVPMLMRSLSINLTNLVFHHAPPTAEHLPEHLEICHSVALCRACARKCTGATLLWLDFGQLAWVE